MKDSIKLKLSKLENKIGLNKNFTIVIHQIDNNTVKYKDKLYEIPKGIEIIDYLKQKFAGKKIIFDDII